MFEGKGVSIKYKCPICGKLYDRVNEADECAREYTEKLIADFKTTGDQRRFVCNVCGKDHATIDEAKGCEALHEAEKDLEEMIESIDNFDKQAKE